MEIKRSPAVLRAIAKIDKLLIESGVRAFCLECVQSPYLIGKTTSSGTPGGGCCGAEFTHEDRKCELLSSSGCTNKPLSCALWLCSHAHKKFPEVSKQLFAIKQTLRKRRDWGYEILESFRMHSLQYEQKLVQIELARRAPKESNHGS